MEGKEEWGERKMRRKGEEMTRGRKAEEEGG
jgi:hypothetical protein